MNERFDPRLKLAMHPQFSAYLAGERVYPINVEISPSGICNASCDFCWYAHTSEKEGHRKVFLDTTRGSQLLRECEALGAKSVSWTGGGDPSLHPDIATFLGTADSLGIEQGMFTNALANPKYDPALLSWVRVTMTDKPYRVEYIRQLRAAKTLGFAFNYSGANDDAYLWETLRVAEEVQADYVQVRPMLRHKGETVDIKPPGICHPLLHITGYKFEEARKPHGYKACEGYHLSCFVWEDGNVDTCAYMRGHQGYTLGNVYKDSLKDILDRAPPSVPVDAQCQVCCKLHETNRAIHDARKVEDRNFP